MLYQRNYFLYSKFVQILLRMYLPIFREELEKQKAALHYQKLHAEGKTEEARADLARLAIIRQQREEAARKREQEKKGRNSCQYK